MNCQNCGNNLNKDVKFCIHCGSKVGQIQPARNEERANSSIINESGPAINSSRSGLDTNIPKEVKGKYSALRILATMLNVTSVIFILMFLASVVAIFAAISDNKDTIALICGGSALISVIFAFFFRMFAEGIKLFLDIEKNTRQQNEILMAVLNK